MWQCMRDIGCAAIRDQEEMQYLGRLEKLTREYRLLGVFGIQRSRLRTSRAKVTAVHGFAGRFSAYRVIVRFLTLPAPCQPEEEQHQLPSLKIKGPHKRD
jgi:hypothetical protein